VLYTPSQLGSVTFTSSTTRFQSVYSPLWNIISAAEREGYCRFLFHHQFFTPRFKV
jgi:hypothetical protein